MTNQADNLGVKFIFRLNVFACRTTGVALAALGLAIAISGCGSSSAGSTAADSTQPASSLGAYSPPAGTIFRGASTSVGSLGDGSTSSNGSAAPPTPATPVSNPTGPSFPVAAPSGAPDPLPGTAPASKPNATKQSVRAWVACDGVTDDTEGLTRALAAASHATFTLLVDCPVRMKVGMDIARTIFIDEGTTVEFSSAGKLIVDNVFIPAFVIANSSNITLTNWNVEYDASLPVNPRIGGYFQNGIFVKHAEAQPANAFSDLRLSQWLTANRSIVFNESKESNGLAEWSGPTNACAVFFLTGDTSNVVVTGMRVYAPATAGGDHFIPVVFSMSPNFKSNQTVNPQTPLTAQYVAVPHNLAFSTISLDGTYMGWVGSAQNATFQNIESRRYADLQDANGNNTGGASKWFAPPHLFYLSYKPSSDPALFNMNIQIANVVDDGIRIGKARDSGGGDSGSGYALSLKLGCVRCTVDTYSSARPDGFLDVLASDGLTITNASATYNSAFLHNIYPGIRFPEAPYKNVTLRNISLTDTAASTVLLPIGNAYQSSNQDLHFQNIQVSMNSWAGTEGLPLPTISGQSNNVSFNYSIGADALRIVRSQIGIGQATVQANPDTVRAGTSTSLTWNSVQSKNCSAVGAWSGPVPAAGSRTIKFAKAGNYDFTLQCVIGNAVSNTTVRVVVT